MIFDHIKNAKQYISIHPLFAAAFEFLQKKDLMELPEGRIELQEGLYALIQHKATKPEAQWETHEKYIDIQMLLKGSEAIGYAHIDGLTCTQPYNPEKDMTFYEGKGNIALLAEGDFMIFFPPDAHKPLLSPGDAPVNIKKVVVKIKV